MEEIRESRRRKVESKKTDKKLNTKLLLIILVSTIVVSLAIFMVIKNLNSSKMKENEIVVYPEIFADIYKYREDKNVEEIEKGIIKPNEKLYSLEKMGFNLEHSETFTKDGSNTVLSTYRNEEGNKRITALTIYELPEEIRYYTQGEVLKSDIKNESIKDVVVYNYRGTYTIEYKEEGTNIKNILLFEGIKNKKEIIDILEKI